MSVGVQELVPDRHVDVAGKPNGGVVLGAFDAEHDGPRSLQRRNPGSGGNFAAHPRRECNGRFVRESHRQPILSRQPLRRRVNRGLTRRSSADPGARTAARAVDQDGRAPSLAVNGGRPRHLETTLAVARFPPYRVSAPPRCHGARSEATGATRRTSPAIPPFSPDSSTGQHDERQPKRGENQTAPWAVRSAHCRGLGQHQKVTRGNIPSLLTLGQGRPLTIGPP